MKRTEPLIVYSRLLRRNIPINDIEYLYTRFYVFTKGHVNYFLIINSILSIFDETCLIQKGENDISISFT